MCHAPNVLNLFCRSIVYQSLKIDDYFHRLSPWYQPIITLSLR
ncbi:Uncharacterised protein [Vibrio cholerae]|nr:Uncharacterised protein [Vibrio cholerae]